MAAAITESELEVVAILQGLSEFIHDTKELILQPCSSISSVRWGAKKRRSTVTAQDGRCKAHRQIDSPSPLAQFQNSPSPSVGLELSPSLSEIQVGQKKISGLVAAELEESAAGTGSPVSPLYFDQVRECADHRRRKALSPSATTPLKRSRVQHKDWVRAQTNEISRLREEHRLLKQKAEAARIHHESLMAENSRLKELRSRISSHQRSHQQLPPTAPPAPAPVPPPRRIETISFPIERKPSPSPAPKPEPRADPTISSAPFANYSRQRVEFPRPRVEIPDLNCFQEPSPAPQPPRRQAQHQWVAPPLERHLYRFEGATPEEKRATTAAARRRRVEIKRKKAAAAAAVPVTAVPAAV